MAIQGQLYHVGIVVPDVEAAQAHLTDLLGLTWGPVLETEALDVRAFDDGGGEGRDLVVPNKLSYSTEPPYIELVQEIPGTVWECNEHSNLHHVGVWTDSLPADSRPTPSCAARCSCAAATPTAPSCSSPTTAIRSACASSSSTWR